MRAALAMLLLAGALLLGAVGAQAQQAGGTLTALIQPEPPTLMVGLNQQGPVQTVAGKIYQGLLTYDFDLKPMPSLARSWEVSADGRTYTFHLEENVRWHDGVPFTAADVIFSTMTFLPETHPRARGTFARVESASASDPHTVVFRLKEPFGPFLSAFAAGSAPMIPKHIYEGTDYRANPANRTPIGTGPFRFAEWKRGQYIRLVRNPDYWKPGRPYLDAIVYRVVPDATARRIALESGEVQLSAFNDIEWFDVPALRRSPSLTYTDKGYEFFSPLAWVELNVRSAPLSDRRFRQALYYALDRNFIRERIFFGQGRVATGPIASTTRFYSPDVTRYAFDPARAEALLDEMGLGRKQDGTRATLRLLVLPYGEAWMRLAEYVKQAWARIGIAVTLEATDAAGWAQKVANWDYEATFDFLYQFGDPALGVARVYETRNMKRGVLFNNTIGYVNPALDAVFDEAAITSPDEARAALYHTAQQMLVEDVPVLWLLELQFPTFTANRLRNAVTTAIGVNDSFDSAYLAK
ncbi:MAG: peptide ABC transporter substrate-binding protein [Rhizobiales bacterium 24-66-13]|jgi:peptide/nickel transport system substrate-binding protein|nr:MAG: peptide ABC transporter substrate-binding protein [Rhizobiales bacterium 32-66-11]OYY14018.1 MAG: peptide ABC transporter substrate-binding protein [Rhizobiales bacterium 35-68-8]OYZ83108.1 MAG: peptide ABC transporter substrate-binding protein [Rhizobiales bacterium 24-66-13]OZB12066.1 MAG: peptide ABC transporter substrate-binding protein [Rhizobiales bacterium 39-66-18]HQS45627.1 ABC transporter substrate-binding protein [Xanthobacteraceae bacterium]